MRQYRRIQSPTVPIRIIIKAELIFHFSLSVSGATIIIDGVGFVFDAGASGCFVDVVVVVVVVDVLVVDDVVVDVLVEDDTFGGVVDVVINFTIFVVISFRISRNDLVVNAEVIFVGVVTSGVGLSVEVVIGIGKVTFVKRKLVTPASTAANSHV